MERFVYISPAIVAILIFLWLKNKQYNRTVERHNRMVDKQDEIIALIRNKKTEEHKQDNNTQENEN
ncbi:MAG: hypothetical protein U0V75_06240 [Ferruginibacter sp.]